MLMGIASGISARFHQPRWPDPGAVAILIVGSTSCLSAHAGFGAYLPGLGARSSGAGGIAYSLAQDTTTLSSNPATARLLGNHFDTTIEYAKNSSNVYIHDNLLGRDQKYNAIDNDYLFPYAGLSLQLSDRLSVAMTGFLAGFGSVYEPSPYIRFGGDDKISLTLAQLGVSTVLAYEIVPTQNIGISLNLSYDALDLKGLGKALASLSETPQHVSDQGLDGAIGVGATLGWQGQITPWLAAGAAYRTQTFSTGKINRYEGLLPDQGALEFPAFFGGGIALTPIADWTLALELQRYDYEGVTAFKNQLEQIKQNRLGSDDGPGFGWRSQNVLRMALLYEPNPALTLRAGFARGTQVLRNSDTLLSPLAPSPTRTYYSIGLTWFHHSGWEWTAAFGYEPPTRVNGRNSIPTLAGGGELDIENSFPSLSISVSRTFDFQMFDLD